MKRITVAILLAFSLLTAADLFAQVGRKLTSSEGCFHFGVTAAIDGDYAVIGASLGDINTRNDGAVYVFRRNGLAWEQEARLIATDGEELDHFGSSVALTGDLLIIGAEGDDDNGDQAGAAYLYKRDGAVWQSEGKLYPSDGAAGARFGGGNEGNGSTSAAASGAYVIIGAHDAQGGGAAYVFKRSDETWKEQARLTGSGGDFGIAVALHGDYAVVGAPGGIYAPGAAYVFVRNGEAWIQQSKLTPADGTGDVRFGGAVSIYGDYVAVGVLGGPIFERPGAVYIFKRDGANWEQQARLQASDGMDNDAFGQAVSLVDNHVIVGAPRFDGENHRGAAYIFEREGTLWIEQARLVGEANENFGRSTAARGNDLVVGAPSGCGAAYSYHLSSIVPTRVERVSGEVPEGYRLDQNYPNPFNPATSISFGLPVAAHARLVIYDMLGRAVGRLLDQPLQPGSYTVSWDASGYPSGTYLYRLSTNAFSQAKYLTVLK